MAATDCKALASSVVVSGTLARCYLDLQPSRGSYVAEITSGGRREAPLGTAFLCLHVRADYEAYRPRRSHILAALAVSSSRTTATAHRKKTVANRLLLLAISVYGRCCVPRERAIWLAAVTSIRTTEPIG